MRMRRSTNIDTIITARITAIITNRGPRKISLEAHPRRTLEKTRKCRAEKG